LVVPATAVQFILRQNFARQFQQLNLGSLELTPTVNGNAVVAANLAVAKLGITLEQVRFTGASTLTSPRGAGT
jgi:hypothetical protein